MAFSLNLIKYLILYYIVYLPFYNSEEHNCDYEKKCNPGESGMVNVHIVSHTHDDAGWLKNVDEYYIGSKKYIDKAGVQYIIDSVMKNLLHSPPRKFSYVEGTYMQRWLSDNERYRHQFKHFVLNGQMEILSGGWVMHDEACTHYNDIVNQMTLGFKTYKDAFEDCGIPRTGWQIDPFGHSAAQADLLAQMGFDGLFLGRVSDYSKYNVRTPKKQLEFMWRPMPDFKDTYQGDYLAPKVDDEFFKLHRTHVQMSPDLFVGILPNLYQPPSGFCFDLFCDDDPIQDDPDKSGYNVKFKVTEFLRILDYQSRIYDTNDLIITMGNDFNYQAAENWYKNLDKLITYVNEKRVAEGSQNKTRFNLFYSTPGCYMYALNKAKKNKMENYKRNVVGTTSDGTFTAKEYQFLRKAKSKADLLEKLSKLKENKIPKSQRKIDGEVKGSPVWSVKRGGDFFPLVNFQRNIWTGYFTSRPTLKGMIRDGSRILQACKQIEAFANLGSPIPGRLLERAVAVAQHHDAVTGTAKQAVTYDYMLRLHKGLLACEDTIKDGLAKLAVLKHHEKLHFCYLLNISRCSFTQSQNEGFGLLLYNPLAWDVEHYLTIPVTTTTFAIYDESGAILESQTEQVPLSVFLIPERLLKDSTFNETNLPHNRDSDLVITFKARVPALGLARYTVKSSTSKPSNTEEPIKINNLDRIKRDLSKLPARDMPPFSSQQVTKYNGLAREDLPPRVLTKLYESANDRSSSFYELVQDLSAVKEASPNWSPDQYKDAIIKAFSEMGMTNADAAHKAEDYFSDNEKVKKDAYKAGDQLPFLENKYLKLTFDPDTNELSTLFNKESNIAVDIRIDYLWYGVPTAINSYGSGAYVFRTNANKANNISQWSHDIIALKLVKGPVYQQARLVYAPWLFFELTLYQDARFLELAWTVGPIPINDSTPKDIVVRIESNISSTVILDSPDSQLDPDNPNSNYPNTGKKDTAFNKFYTDSNGRFVVPRYVNQTELTRVLGKDLNYIAKQYYPINTKLYVKDENVADNPSLRRQLGVVTDRAQGATSLFEGDLEIMVHRRTLIDDSLGVGEPLNELGPKGQGLKARGRHYLVFDTSQKCNEIMTKLAQEVYLSPLVAFTSNKSSDSGTQTNLSSNPINQFVFGPLPPNLHLLTLYRWSGQSPTILLRLEHIYSPGEHPELSRPVTIDLGNIFKTFTIKSMTELALGANQDLSSVHRFKWSTDPYFDDETIFDNKRSTSPMTNSSTPAEIKLNPLEIRTFMLKVEM